MGVSFNIGYLTDEYGGRSLTDYPIHIGSFKAFKKAVRSEVSTIMDYAIRQYVPKSSICLYLTINSKRGVKNFIIHMKNVREYRQLLEEKKNAA
jgi:hypothetical protein